MNYEEAISYIEKVSCSGIMPGLVRIQALLEKTGHPEMDCNVIHVAGTNGKGSVCTYIASILMQADIRSDAMFHRHFLIIESVFRSTENGYPGRIRPTG